ncbi:MAG: hypothetical protein A2Y10_10030 [Planctomycetes bacterium GWF2_41_51]|nr:MAG: hypothetical protein A2Y10_10030 [Planctomycetes bacterium GWF2_41_51]HBG26434.1 hypothetical protein [Phycisphaerales bacterium]
MKRLIVFILIFSSSICCADIRHKIILNGIWQGVKGENLTEIPAAGWQDTTVPGKTDSYGVGVPEYLWVKRQIDIPQDWQGSRIFVYFGGASFDAHVYIDGKLIGKALDGWSPFEFEITHAVKTGSSHLLQLRCQDRTAVYTEGFVFEPNQPENVLEGKILAPLGGHLMFFGPWDDIFLISRPNTYIDDITIVTSTRKNSLTVKGTISKTEANDLWIQGKVIDSNETVLEIPINAADGNSFEISASFTNAKYWSPENPHLYKLHLTLHKGKDGAILDTLDERFGFKEFWIEGPDFYLNGVKRHLLASSTWPAVRSVPGHAEIRKKLEMVKAGNNNTFRFHTSPWPKRWNDIADEVGVMIVNEAAVYTDRFGMYAYNDERFWKNYREHLKNFIKRNKNNASLIMWSIENEILFMGMEKYCPDLAKKLGDLGRFAKQLDPHHPITFEADIDPDDAADVIGLHYPHELPTYTDWPNTADWLAKRTQTEAGGGMLGVTRRNFYWDRSKPLYIGEYLWVPQEDYAAGTIFFGDDAFIDKNVFHLKAKLQAWIDQTIAYRRMGVSAICPWTCFGHGVCVEENDKPFYEAQKDFYRPIAAFLRNKDTRFFSGDTVERTFDVFNDSDADCNLILNWKLADSNQFGEQKYSLQAGGYKEVKITFTAPDVITAKEIYLESGLASDNKAVQTKYVIEKRQDIIQPAGANVFLYDPCGTFTKYIPFAKKISSFEELKPSDILIIAPQASTKDVGGIQQIGSSGFDSRKFLSFIEKGGKAIVLEQSSLDKFRLNLSLAAKASTMTFALNKEHPLLKGIDSEDLKFWRGDNYVTSYEIIRPACGGARAITVSGGNLGLEHCAILEQPFGKGNILFIQALVGTKLDSEPAARKIFQNSLDYMAGKESQDSKMLVFAEDSNFTRTLVNIGVKQNRIHDINENTLKDVDILVLHEGGEKIIKEKEAIASFLKSGKTVYWHCPDAKTFDELKSIFNADKFEIASSQGPVAINSRDNKLFTGISREDLLFIDRQKGWRRELSLDPGVIDRALMPERNPDELRALIEAKKMELKGNSISIDGNEVVFKSRGMAIGWIDVPKKGIYDLSLIAGGTQLRGTYPLVLIKVDEHAAAQVSVSGEEIMETRFLAQLPAGKSKLQIHFLNGDDWEAIRILKLKGIGIGSVISIPENIEILTLPAALTSIKAGSGRVVIDNVRWENDADNIKGLRYASALFANLGASFEMNIGENKTWLLSDRFKLIGDSPHFEKTNTQLILRNNGIVAAEFNCAAQGEYTLLLKGYSTPVNGKYAEVEVKIDDKVIGKKEIASRNIKEFEIASTNISQGKHIISITYLNDTFDKAQDLNLYIDEFGFKAN